MYFKSLLWCIADFISSLNHSIWIVHLIHKIDGHFENKNIFKGKQYHCQSMKFSQKTTATKTNKIKRNTLVGSPYLCIFVFVHYVHFISIESVHTWRRDRVAGLAAPDAAYILMMTQTWSRSNNLSAAHSQSHIRF